MGVNPTQKNENKHLKDPLLSEGFKYCAMSLEITLTCIPPSQQKIADEEYDKYHPRWFASSREVKAANYDLDRARAGEYREIKYNQGASLQAEFSISHAVYLRLRETDKLDIVPFSKAHGFKT